jgi:hypothetical protein
MNEPTPPHGSEPEPPADGTRPFAAPVPPQPDAAEPAAGETATATSAQPPARTAAAGRRSTLLRGSDSPATRTGPDGDGLGGTTDGTSGSGDPTT